MGSSKVSLLLLLFCCCLCRMETMAAPSPEKLTCCERLDEIGFSSNLPVIIIDDLGTPITAANEKTPIELCTCGSPNGEDYNGNAKARIRGNSSVRNKKKSFSVDTTDDDGGKNNVEFLGFPKEHDWALYGPEPDRSLGLENFITYNMYRAADNWAARTEYVEVFVVHNNSKLSLDDYNGVYIAMERIKRDGDRVDVAKWDESLEGPEKGGVVFGYDNDNFDEYDLLVGPAQGIAHPFVIKDPNEEDFTPEASQAFLDFINRFQIELFSPDFPDSNYKDYIDMQGLIDYFLMVEVTKNPDGYRGSTFLFKELDGPIKGGIPWDYNEAYGQCCGYPIEGFENEGKSGPGVSGGSAISPNGWRFNICEDQERCQADPSDGISIWFRQLWKDPSWRQAVADRWFELREGPWTDEAFNNVIDGAVEELDQGAAERNYEKWSEVLDVEIPPGLPAGPEQWITRVEQLRKWLLAHLAWMDEELAAISSGKAAGPSVEPLENKSTTP